MTSTTSVPILPPPVRTTGPIAWLRDNLFSSVTNAILTIVGLFLIWRLLAGVLDWAFLSAVWNGPNGAYVSSWRVWELFTQAWATTNGAPCRQAGTGACWPFVAAKFPQFMYGRFPLDERWRVDLTYLLLIAGLVALMVPRIPGKLWSALFTFGLYPLIAFWLLNGSYARPTGWQNWAGLVQLPWRDLVAVVWLDVAGVVLTLAGLAFFWLHWQERLRNMPLGAPLIGTLCLVVGVPLLFRLILSTSGVVYLKPVPTELWGGLLVTLVVALVGLTGAFPIGILLALGRRSKMPLVRWASVTFIEFVRGVPLITILFMSSVMLPLFLPEGVSFDKLLRALIGVMLFQGAYLAETIRGGLQALPRGQFEAAEALGLDYRQKMALIVLPQALKLVIPGIVNSFVGLFKDTSLVLIIGLFDLLGIVQLNSNADPNWAAPTTNMTGYVFAGLIFFVFCYGISRYSQSVERRLAQSEHR
jgi:general L-amino acid transport system permease protein